MVTRRSPTSLDARHRTELARIETDVRSLLGAESRSAWDVGKRLRRIMDAKLYAAAGYATFNDYVVQALDLSKVRAHLLKAVSRFSRAHVERFGWTKLALVLRLWRLVPGTQDVTRVDAYTFEVLVDGRMERRRLEHIPNKVLEDTIEHLNDLEHGKIPLDPRVVRLVDGLEQGMEGVRTFDARGDVRRDVPLLSVFRIPIAEVVRFWCLLGMLLSKLGLLSEREAAACALLEEPAPVGEPPPLSESGDDGRVLDPRHEDARKIGDSARAGPQRSRVRAEKRGARGHRVSEPARLPLPRGTRGPRGNPRRR